MVVDRDKWITKACRQQVEEVLVALQSLAPSTPKGQQARDYATNDLKSAKKSLDTLYRHYCHYHRPKPPPKEGDHDLP